jgi:hypothetical protein
VDCPDSFDEFSMSTSRSLLMALAVSNMQVIVRGLREDGGNSVTSIATSLQRCINGIVIAGLHSNVQVVPVTDLSKPCMNFKILC